METKFALRATQKKYSNSCVVRKKILNETKTITPPFKLNGLSLRSVAKGKSEVKLFACKEITCLQGNNKSMVIFVLKRRKVVR